MIAATVASGLATTNTAVCLLITPYHLPHADFGLTKCLPRVCWCWQGNYTGDYLDMANVQNERTMKVFLRSAPANFLVKYRNSDGLVARIRRQLRHIPPDTWPDFETLARQLHFSASTLRRHLIDEGQSYQSIKDALRLDLAISQLCHSDKSVEGIALDLGFAEASAFHRAFKKWTGTRPGEYRRALAGQ